MRVDPPSSIDWYRPKLISLEFVVQAHWIHSRVDTGLGQASRIEVKIGNAHSEGLQAAGRPDISDEAFRLDRFVGYQWNRYSSQLPFPIYF
jgi:hypothetical protein